MNTPRLNPRPVFASALGLVLAGGVARAVDIDVAIDPPGSVTVGQVVTVNLSVSGWNAADGEVDAVSFRIDFDPNYFEFVPGSGIIQTDGSEFLALPTQGAGYVPANDSDDSIVEFGRYLFGVTDVGDATGGSIGPGGSLGSFQLRAIASGASSLTPGTNNPDDVFADTSLNGIAPTGGVSFNALPVITFTPMTYAIWAAAIAFPAGQDDPEDDPDGDLVCNLMEYTLDMNPLLMDRGKLPLLATIELAGMNYLSFTYQRPTGSKLRTDLTYTPRRSTDLTSWLTAGVTVESVSAPDPVTELETVVVRSSTAVGANGLTHEFLSLFVSL